MFSEGLSELSRVLGDSWGVLVVLLELLLVSLVSVVGVGSA